MESLSPLNRRSPRTHFYKGRSKIKKYLESTQALGGTNQAESDMPSVTDMDNFKDTSEPFWTSFQVEAYEHWLENHAEIQTVWGFPKTNCDIENFCIWYRVAFCDPTIPKPL